MRAKTHVRAGYTYSDVTGVVVAPAPARSRTTVDLDGN